MAEVENKVIEFAQESAETVESNKNRLKKAIDAGVDAIAKKKPERADK